MSESSPYRSHPATNYQDPRNWPGTPEHAAETGNPMDLIKGLLSNQPDFAAEAARQLASVYNPQFQQLNSQVGLTKKQAGESDAALKAMYTALAKGIKGQRGQVAGNFNSAIRDVNKSYSQGGKTIANAFSRGNNELAGLFQQLGIEAAGADPRTLQQNQRDSQLMQGLLAVNGAASKNALTGQRQGSLDFNTDQQGIARQEGAMQRSQLQRALQDKLAGFSQQRLNLSSQQAGAQSDLTNSLQNNWLQQQNQLAAQAMQSWEAQQKAAAEATKVDRPSPYQQYQMMGPIDKAYSRAAELFGTNTPQASQAVAMLTALGDQKQFHNGFEFIQDALEANRANANRDMTQALPEDQLRALAAYLYDQMNPQALPSYVQN